MGGNPRRAKIHVMPMNTYVIIVVNYITEGHILINYFNSFKTSLYHYLIKTQIHWHYRLSNC